MDDDWRKAGRRTAVVFRRDAGCHGYAGALGGYDVRPGSSQLTSLSCADKSVCGVLRTAFVQARQN